MTAVCQFFPTDQFLAIDEERKAAIKAWKEAHPDVDTSAGWPSWLRAVNDLYFPPGSMWFCPWYHDPSKPEDMAKAESRLQAMTGHETQHPRHAEGYRWFLSIHYYRDWARIRPPICVVCPGGDHWIPDQCSSNGSGWTVTGDVPRITCTPSIWVSQGAGPPREYHGWLNDGVFSAPC